MPFLQNERSRIQSEIQAAATQIAQLTAQLQSVQQAVAAAQARVSAAQAGVSGAQARMPPLEAAAASADERVAQGDQQVEAHLANEPEQVFEVDGRPPRPNPAWRTWRTQFDRLNQQLTQARGEAAAALARLNEGRTQVSQAVAEVQAAGRQLADATNAVQATQLALAGARQRQDAAQARSATVDRWNEEIARDPIGRTALEQIAAELSDRAATREDAYAVARVQHEIAQETLASLTARRDQLTPALNQVNAQLPAASQELSAARSVLTSVSRNIQTHRRRGPLP